jgi:hypothetical protein
MKPVTTLATSRTPDGEPLILQEHDGQYFMNVGGVQLMGTNVTALNLVHLCVCVCVCVCVCIM